VGKVMVEMIAVVLEDIIVFHGTYLVVAWFSTI
jgi:hypothetical protein